MKKILARLKREPVVLRGAVIAAFNLIVASGVIDTGARTEAELVVLGLIDLFLLKGARDRVTPAVPTAYTVTAR